MKAERRHELQENSLAKFMDNLPVMARLYADRILLVIVLILLVIVLIRWRTNANAEREVSVANSLATARDNVQRLGMMPAMGPGEQIAAERSKIIDTVNASIDDISSNASASDTSLQARALLTRGDLYWTLANLPPLPGAATQPTLRLSRTSDEYLSQSADAYQNVLKNFPSQPDTDLAANFGLAAIAENRHNWDEAAKTYQQIKDSNVDQMYKDLADARLKLLPEIEKPMLVGDMPNKPVQVPFAAASQPATTQPTTQAFTPATQPTTQPLH
jgi:hypothetical protein